MKKPTTKKKPTLSRDKNYEPKVQRRVEEKLSVHTQQMQRTEAIARAVVILQASFHNNQPIVFCYLDNSNQYKQIDIHPIHFTKETTND